MLLLDVEEADDWAMEEEEGRWSRVSQKFIGEPGTLVRPPPPVVHAFLSVECVRGPKDKDRSLPVEFGFHSTVDPFAEDRYLSFSLKKSEVFPHNRRGLYLNSDVRLHRSEEGEHIVSAVVDSFCYRHPDAKIAVAGYGDWMDTFPFSERSRKALVNLKDVAAYPGTREVFSKDRRLSDTHVSCKNHMPPGGDNCVVKNILAMAAYVTHSDTQKVVRDLSATCMFTTHASKLISSDSASRKKRRRKRHGRQTQEGEESAPVHQRSV